MYYEFLWAISSRDMPLGVASVSFVQTHKILDRDWDKLWLFFITIASLTRFVQSFEPQKYVLVEYQSDRSINTCTCTVWL